MPTRFKGAAREVRALDAFIKLNRATESITAALNRALAEENVTFGQLSVLEALLHVGPLSPSDLGRKLLRSNANMTTVLDNLERDGFIRRERSSADRRALTIHLTAEGRRRIEKIFPPHASRIAAAMGALTAAEQDELGRLCRKLGLAVSAGD